MTGAYDIHGNMTKWSCEQPDPHEGIVCPTCAGEGLIAVFSNETGRYEPRWCPDCGGRGKP